MLPVPPRPTLGQLRTILAVVVVLVFLFTSYYQVEPDEVGVVQRFGRFVGTSGPGPHLKIPFGVDSVTKVVVEWVVQYKIKDPKKYLFDVREPTATFRDMSEAAMRQVVGDHSVDEVITIGRETIALEAKQQLQDLCNLYGIGIDVQQLVLQDVNPPDPVKPAFNEVNQAIQEKERAINDAWADYNKSVPRAKGEAEQAIRSAEGYALERVNKAQGDASRFEALYEEYRKAAAVTRKRIYFETLAQVLPKVGRKLIVDEKAKGILPLLQLEGDRKEPKP
jgi:membrane protease subunit HflK